MRHSWIGQYIPTGIVLVLLAAAWLILPARQFDKLKNLVWQ